MSDEEPGLVVQLAGEFARLNAEVERAHQAIQDMRAERQRMREQLAAIVMTVDDRFEAAVAAQVDALGKATSDAMRGAVQRVDHKIDRYLELALGYDPAAQRSGKMPLPEIAELIASRAEGRAPRRIPAPGEMGASFFKGGQ